MTYNRNSSITSLTHTGNSQAGYGNMDFLSYSYTGIGNNASPSFVTRLSARANFKDVNLYGQTSSAYPSTDRYNRVTSLDIINGRFNSSIYMVGGKRLGLRGRFFPSVTPINPWRRSINGKGYNTRLTPF